MAATNIPNGAIVKFSNSPEVYLVDNGRLRHFTREVKMKNGQSIFTRMVTLDPSFKSQFSLGSPISDNIPFDAPHQSWSNNIPKTAPAVNNQSGNNGSTTTTNTGDNFTWKQGLNPTQKDSITKLIDKIKNGYTPNNTDKDNLAYALGPNWQSQVSVNTGSDPNTGTNVNSELENSLYDEVESGNFTKGEKEILKQIISGDYTSGQHIPTQEEINKIIEDAAINAEADLTPYYEKLTGRELEDLKTKLSDIRNATSKYLEQEAIDYKTKLQQTKDTLRTKGLTFSGTSRKVLGKEAAISDAGVRGTLDEQRERDIEKDMTTFQTTTRDLGTEAERRLGSSRVTGLDWGTFATPYRTTTFYNPTGGVNIGDIDLEKKKAIEESKWARVNQQAPFYYR